MISENGNVQTSPKGSFSFPYGAAAMSRQLADLSTSDIPESARDELAATMKQNFRQAYAELELPPSLRAKAKSGSLSLYLSGGGFRGWGYLLLSQHKISPYPIPLINGFQVTKQDFQNIADIQTVAAEQEIFRISKRRAAQVPAVAFLVDVLVDALPMIKDIRFCQGGVREGFLFDSLDTETKAMDPLPAASSRYSGPSSADIAELLMTALPGENDLGRFLPDSFTSPVIRALADMMYVHSSLPKESTSLAALYAPITGQLASAHGISHTNRAILSLVLCQRWDSDLAPPHDLLKARLRQVLTPQEAFWCNYLGSVAKIVGDVYPAGRISQPRLKFEAHWSSGLGKKGLHHGVVLTIHAKEGDSMTTPDVLRNAIEKIESVGKKKNRIGGRSGFGVPIEVSINRDLA
jgi:retrograde regulation protein 2